MEFDGWKSGLACRITLRVFGLIYDITITYSIVHRCGTRGPRGHGPSETVVFPIANNCVKKDKYGSRKGKIIRNLNFIKRNQFHNT